MAGLIEKLVEMSIGVASIAILARYLDVEIYGLYTLITTFAGLVLILCNTGLDRVMVRDIAANREHFLKYLPDVKGASIILAGISLSLIILIALSLGLNNKMAFGLVFLFAISELISMYLTVYMSVFRAFEKMEYNTFITFIAKILAFIGLIIVVYLNLGLVSIFISLAMSNVIKALLTISIFKRYFSRAQIHLSFDNSGALIKESLIIAVSIFFAVASLRMGVFMLKVFGTLKDVAYFQAANALFIMLQPLSIVIGAALYPVISKREQNAALIFEKASKYLLIAGLPLMAVTFFYGKELIMLIYGGNYMDAVPAMKILVLSVMFAFLANLFEVGLLSERRQNLLTIGWGITFAFNIALGVLLVPKYGLIGSAAAMSLSYTALFFVLYFFGSNYTIFKMKGSIFLKPLAAFVVMVLYLYYFTTTGKRLNITFDILNVSVSLVLYMTVLVLLKAFSLKEIEFVKNLLMQRKISELS